MQDMLSRMKPDDVIGLVAVVMGIGCGLAAIVGGIWYKVRAAEAEAALKRDMLAAGVPADDIVRIVSATAGGKLPPAPPRA